MRRRVLILGLDGGTWRILQPVLDAGMMPWLAGLCRQGCRGILASTTPAITPAAWISFQTGREPGRHGVYDFAGFDRTRRTLHYVNSRSYSDTMWDRVGAAGGRVGIVNLPLTYPAWPIQGYMVTGLQTPNLQRDWTWPPELAGELLAKIPDYHIFSFESTKQGNPHRNPEGFLERVTDILKDRTRAALHILAKEPLDLFMVHFQATDVIQHVYWGYLDERHPYYSPRIRDLVWQRFFRALDEQLRTVHEAFERNGGPGLTWVVSDHGFQSHLTRFQFGNWLVKQGWTTVRRRPRSHAWLRDFLGARNLFGMQEKLQRTRRGRKLVTAVREPVLETDWENTRIYSFSRGGDGYVFVLDEDPARREETLRQLSEQIRSITEPKTGRPVIEQILPREDLYHGSCLNQMPDLILRPAPGYSVTGEVNPYRDDLFVPIRKGFDFHVGMHHPDGILLVAGESVRTNSRIAGARLVDVAPTILACLGLEVPTDMDGVVLQDVFERRLPVCYGQPAAIGTPTGVTSVFSPQDIQQIEDRLRDLGYIA